MDTITNAEFREIAENAISYLHDNDLLEDFLEDRGIELDKDKREYFSIEETMMTKNTNPCENCGYHWQENWESFPSCHYEGPSAWSPCEAEETAKRDELERREYEEEIRAMCEDYEREVAKLSRRAEVVRAMELIARCINDEEIFESWLIDGVADGDINEDDEDLEYYCEDDNFADLMNLFLRLMAKAKADGGLYCDGITSERR